VGFFFFNWKIKVLKPHFLIHPKFVFFGIVGFFYFSHFLGKIFDRQCHLHLHLGVALEILHLICNGFFNVSLPLFLHKLYLRYFYFYLFFLFYCFSFILFYLFGSVLNAQVDNVFILCLCLCFVLSIHGTVCLFILYYYFIFHRQKGNFKSKILYTLLSPVTNIKKNPFFKFIE
jgi:hypothetical protein